MTARTLPALLLERGARHPHKTAMRDKQLGLWQESSWQDYLDSVTQVANALLAHGVAAGSCVALISENRPEWVYADLGIQSIGAITAAIYVTSAADQVAYVVDHCQASLIFVEDEEQLDKVLSTREQLPALRHIVVFDWKGLRGFSDPMVMQFDEFLDAGRRAGSGREQEMVQRIASLSPDATALLVYTSGTTGPPKGAMLSHNNLIATGRMLNQVNPIHESDEALSFLPLCHIAERMMTVVNQLLFGYTVNFAESLDTVSQNLREVSPTILFAVPRIWEKFHSRILLTMREAELSKQLAYASALRVGYRVAALREKGRRPGLLLAGLYRLAHLAVFHPLRKRLGLDRTRLAISGAAPVSPEILRYFHAIGLQLREVYGQTEGTGPTSIHRGEDIRVGTVGPPLPGVEVKLAEDGEILVKGENVFQGYFRAPEATADTIIDGYLHSGDLGQFTEDGCLKITGRKKDLIITGGGKNVAPQNIENQLKFSPYINDAVVVGDNRPFLTALLLIDEENVTDFAQENRIPFTTYADLTRNREIQKLLDQEVDGVNRTLARVEQVRRFTILDRRLEEEDGEVTPTMKVKRMNIARMYAEVIEAMYKR